MGDLILFNANVITLSPEVSAEDSNDQWIVIHGNNIQAIGKNKEFRQFHNKKARLIDCQGKTVLPGFIDAHSHLRSLAESYLTLNLGPQNNIRSIPDIQKSIMEVSRRTPPGDWIRGRGYNEFSLAEKRHPTRQDLDSISSVHPIKLTHRTGHAHVLNTLALRRIGISTETPDPEDGLIERDIQTGEPTGVLFRMGELLASKIPPLDDQELDCGLKIANEDLLSMGITSIQDASAYNGVEQWNMFGRWKKEGFFKPRVGMMLGIKNFPAYRRQEFEPYGDKNQLRLSGVKILLDETTGQILPNQNDLNDMVLKTHQSGCQASLHAVEENTVEAACIAIAHALQKLPRSDHRHRIEHCSLCPQALAEKLASCGIIVVTQPSFIYYNGERYLKTVSKNQVNFLYPVATLMKQGVTVAGSSDFPVVPPNPIMGIYAAASRTAQNGEVISPGERIAPIEALRMFTANAAKAGFEEKVKGTLSPGKLADMVILNGDPTRLAAEEMDRIKEMKVEMTILDGEVVWERMS